MPRNPRRDNLSKKNATILKKEVKVADFEVEKIINRMLIRDKDRTKPVRPWYEIKWFGYDESENTFEPVDNLNNCTALLATFERERLASIKVLEQHALKAVKSIDFIKKENKESEDNDISHKKKTQSQFASSLRQLFQKETSPVNQHGDTHLGTPKRSQVIIVDDDEVDFEFKDENVVNLRWEVYEKTPIMEEVKEIKVYDLMSTSIDEEWYDLQDMTLPHFAEWEKLLRNCKRPWPLIQNHLDSAGPPKTFTWIEENIFDHDVNVRPLFSQFLAGCDCKRDSCHETSCQCPSAFDFQGAYDKEGLLKKDYKENIVVECNLKCECDVLTCPNRVVQRGRRHRLSIFRCAKGWGVKTLQFMPQGSLIDEYIGEIITRNESSQRGIQNRLVGSTYLFALDAFINIETEREKYTMDANYFGNVTHFINHSCRPNLHCYAVVADSGPPDFHRLAFFAKRDIQKGEELTFDYGGLDHKSSLEHGVLNEKSHSSSDSNSDQQIRKRSRTKSSYDSSHSSNSEDKENSQMPIPDFFKCLCGERECRGVIKFR